MGQKIIAGNHNQLHDTITEYCRITGYDAWSVGETFAKSVYFPVAGTLRNLRVRLVDNGGSAATPSSGEQFAFTVRKNGASTSLVVTITDASSDEQDLVNTVDVAPNDYVILRCVPSGGNVASRYALWSFEFDPDVAGESVYFNDGVWWKTQADGYATFLPTADSPYAYTEANMECYIATAGKIKTLRVSFATAPGTGAEGYRITLRKNGVSTAMAVTISGTATSGSYTATEITVAAGDLVDWFVQKLNSPSENVRAQIAVCFDPDDNDENLLINGFTSALNISGTKYYFLSHNISGWGSVESDVRQLTQGSAFKNLYVKVSAAPGAGKSWTFTVMRNGVATDIEVVIADAATTGTDLSNELTLADDDTVSLRCTPSGTPADADARWGMVQTASNAPAVTTQAVSSIAQTTATGNGNITDLGDPNPTAHGVCYNTTGSPTVADSTTDEGTATTTGAYTSSMTSLVANTPYYVKAYATNTRGTSYGSEVNFTTLEVPTVTTQAVTSILSVTATGNGNITDLGNPNPTAHGHCWATTTNPTTALSTKTDNGAASATGAFTSAITGLAPGTGYYTRAYATNTAGTGYGENVYFITSLDQTGFFWIEDTDAPTNRLHFIDPTNTEQTDLAVADVDDTPVNGATTAPVSSNWAYDQAILANGVKILGYLGL